jgi:nucleoside phosphorylase
MSQFAQPVDVLIIAVLPKFELAAVERMFGIPQDEGPGPVGNGDVWLRQIQTRHSGILNLAVAFIGDQGNSTASASTTKLLMEIRPRLVLLTGTAAGIRGKVKLGDVIVCGLVVDYEGARLTAEGSLPRIDRKETDDVFLKQVQLFDGRALTSNWIKYFQEAQQQLSYAELPPASVQPESHAAWIASGEKLLADGSLAEIAKKHDERIRGGEKEGFGFATAANKEHVPWLIVRGVSDHGDPQSKDGNEKDKYHPSAMNAAAGYIRAFLEDGLVLDNLRTLTEVYDRHASNQWKPLRIEAALISTEDKTGIEVFAGFLKNNGVRLISTPGVQKYFASVGINIESTWDFTGTPKLFEFRATLHPYLLACLATTPDASERCSALKAMGMCPIGLVICNAKPAPPPAGGATLELAQYIAEMNIGVPLLLRWAIRQWTTTATVVSPNDYPEVVADLKQNRMCLSPGLRKQLFRRTLRYVFENDRHATDAYDRLWPKDL